MNNESYYGAIRDQIFRMKEGSVVAMKDFESVATYDSIRKTLSRLCELKLIVRIVPGICIPQCTCRYGRGQHPAVHYRFRYQIRRYGLSFHLLYSHR